jgi:ketosteroid isomerase-like protein
MSRNEVESVVRKFYADRMTNEVDRTLEAWDDNAVFKSVGCPDCSKTAGVAKGLDVIRQPAEAILADWIWKDLTIQSLLVDGNQASVFYSVTVMFKPTGETFETEVANLFTVENGKITSFIEYLDTAKFMRVSEAEAA